MAYSRMSFVNAIFVSLFFVSYVTGETATRCSFREPTTYHLADVARFYWVKRKLKWAVKDPSGQLTKKRVRDVMNDAFKQWGKKYSFKFDEVSPSDEHDIAVSFQPLEPPNVSHTVYSKEMPPKHRVLDGYGATIIFSELINWSDKRKENWRNFEFAALHEAGHAMGLFDSDEPRAVMYKGNLGFVKPDAPELTKDDYDGMKFIYGAP